MTASLETLVIAAYVFADRRRSLALGPGRQITDAELVALAVAQAATGVPSDRQFLGLVPRCCRAGFPICPTRRNTTAGCVGWRRDRRVQLRVAELIAEGELRLADGTLIACANYPGCASRSHFAGTAAYGYCPPRASSSGACASSWSPTRRGAGRL